MNPRYETLCEMHADALRDGRIIGFPLGPALVTRVDTGERGHILALDTPFRSLLVELSPTGRTMHLFIDGAELVEVKDG